MTDAKEAGASVTTRAELLQRLEQRPTPAPLMHHTPGGSVETATNRQVNADNENRIAHLQDRLQRARDDLERDHAFANVVGRARGDFERSR